MDVDTVDLDDRVAQMAQARYVSAASIDAAIALSFKNRGVKAPSPEVLARKLRVTFSPELWETVLARVAEGESVYTICHDDGMPPRTTLYRWMLEDSKLAEQYETALQLRADKYVEQINDLSGEAKQRAGMGASNEEVTAIKLAVNSLQWTASKLHPKKYGERQQLDIDAKVKLDEPQVDARLAALVAKARAGKDTD